MKLRALSVAREDVAMFKPLPKVNAEEFAFPVQCIWLKINGSWPIETRFKIFEMIYNFWSLFVIFMVGITIYFQSAFLVSTFISHDILMLTENCCTTFMGLHNFMRIIHMRTHRTHFRKLLDDFVNYIWISTESHAEIKKKCEREMIIFKIMSTMLFALIWMYCLLPLFELFNDLNSPQRPFPYKMIFFFHANDGYRYIVTYIFTSFAGFAVVTTLFAEDSLFGFFVTYSCGQFAILHEHIENMQHDEEKSTVNFPRSDEEKPKLKLKEVVKRHNILINFCSDLDKFFSPILLVNFTISAILICMVGFQIVTVKMEIGNMAKFVLYILSALSQLFVLCWMGDNIISASYATKWKFYSSNWEKAKKYNKDLSFAIFRSQKPVRITALKFSVLSLQSFTTILSTSMSYFTLLRTVFEDE